MIINKKFNYLPSIAIVLLIFSFAQLTWKREQTSNFDVDTKLSEVLAFLGDERPKHAMIYTSDQVRMGEEIVKKGRTVQENGKKSNYVSIHYVCTTCHNVVQEDPDLRKSDPEIRLPYVKAHKIPFLQGTTFKGIVNRESWYNDDYVKKYGDEKIGKAHNDLKESIQLCAVECSQGRPMEEWEIDAVLAYYWSIEFNLGDLSLSETEFKKLNQSPHTEVDKTELITWIKSFYLQASPAHFYDAPPNKNVGYEGLEGDPNIGKDIYELSCLYCHKYGGVSHYVLDNSSLSFKDLDHYITKNSHFSLYQIIPYGTYAIPGHKPYMPHYPEERMSKQQVEDLKSYINQQSNHTN